MFITDMYRLTTSNGNCSCTGSDGCIVVIVVLVPLVIVVVLVVMVV